MPVDAFLKFEKADGESVQKGHEKWIEIQSWSWGVHADTSWTKGGGASVGKPDPDRMAIDHIFDSASTVVLGFICTGKAFPKAELHMLKTTGQSSPETYLAITMEGVFITKVLTTGTADGKMMQRIEFVFKTIKIEYQPADPRSGALGAGKIYTWDIPAGTASPSS